MDRHIFRVVDPRGIALGTGFAIAEYVFITCLHVVAGLTRVELRAAGLVIQGDVDLDASLATLDLATIRTPAPLPSVWPIEYGWQVDESVQLSGYQRQDVAPDASFPTIGRIAGSTTVPYRFNDLVFPGEGVLHVEHAVVEPGLSGGPAILVKDDVVIGVVVSRAPAERGFVIPFSRVPPETELGRVLSDNRLHVPRYGRFLNAAGLRVRADEYSLGILNELQELGHYSRDRHIRRDEAAGEVLQCVSAGRPMCPVIAPSGVGKTHFIAGLVEELRPRYPVVFVRAAAYDFQSLDLLVASVTSTDSAQISAALDRVLSGGTRLVVAIDGLNEAAVNVSEVRRWLLNAQRWLGAHGVTLIIGCRPEYWDLVKSAARTADPVRLAWFSDEERDRAAARYGVGAPHKMFSYPLLLRLAAPAAPTPPVADRRSSVAAAMERFGQLAVEKSAVAMAGDLTERQIWDRVTRVGRALASRDDLWLPLAQYEEIAGPPPLPTVLIREGLIQETSHGVRPMFDELGYWLQAKALATEPVATVLALPQSVFVMPYALPGRPDDEIDRAVTQTLRPWQATPPSVPALNRVAFMLSQVDGLRLSDDNLRTFTEQVLAVCETAVDAIVFIEPLLLADNLADDTLMQLLWTLAPLEHEHPFRVKDWDGGLVHRTRRESFPADIDGSPQAEYEFARYALAVICRSDAAFEQVMQWTTDVRPLRRDADDSNEATVGSWTGAVIVRALGQLGTSHRNRVLEFVAESLAESSRGGRYVVRSLAEAIVARWPDETFDFWDRRLRAGEVGCAGLMAVLADVPYANDALKAYDVARWTALRTRAFDLASDEATRHALGRSLAPDSPVFEEWFVELLKAGQWPSSLSGLEKIVHRRAAECVDAIHVLLQASPQANARIAAEVLSELCTTLDAQSQKSRIVALIQSHWSVFDPDGRRMIAWRVEISMSGEHGAGLLDPAVATLSEWVMRRPDLDTDALTHGAFAAAQSARPELVAAALRWFETLSDLRRVTKALVYDGGKALPFEPGWRLMRTAAHRLDGTADGPSLMVAIYHGKQEWRSHFLQWLHDPVRSSDASYLLKMLRETLLADPAKELSDATIEVRDSATR